MIAADKLANLENGEGYLGIESQMKKALVYLIPPDKNGLMILPGKVLLKEVFGKNMAVVLSREELRQFAEELLAICETHFEG